jgi:hypothetical protein
MIEIESIFNLEMEDGFGKMTYSSFNMIFFRQSAFHVESLDKFKLPLIPPSPM